MRAKRILWLLNHETLSKFELPLIKDMGFEIYTPKIVPKVILQSSGSVTYQFDDTLTIPEEDLKILNEYNFYSLTETPLYIKKIINTHFSIAFTFNDSAFWILKNLIHNFNGLIFLRAFGEGGSRFKSYSELLDFYFDEVDHYRLQQLRGKFIFSQCYPNLADIEKDFYREAALYMPLGLPEDFYDIQNQWTGKSDKLLFFCTRIKYVSESEKIYNQFKKDFKGFDYIIAGNQPVPVDDPKVTGFLERDKLNELYKSCKVMYYHSTNPRHLHYHPLEAMIAGMPVVYMAGGLLSFLGGKQQSGACETVNEARAKIKRIFSGDKQLINNIIEDQREILYKFSYEFVRNQWETNFIPHIDNINTNSFTTPAEAQKISLFMPYELEKNHLNDYKEFVEYIYKAIKHLNPQHIVEISTHDNEANSENELSSLAQDGIAISEYNYKILSLQDAVDSLSLMFKPQSLWHTEYLLPVDFAHNYVNSDFWFFLLDDLKFPIAPIKPYGIYVEDIADRYYDLFSPIRIYNLKMASFIFTHSQITKSELIKHLGIDKHKIFVYPLVPSSGTSQVQIDPREEYDVIEMDISKPKYVMEIVNRLNDYFQLYRSNKQIKLMFNNYNKGENDLLLDDLGEFIRKSSALSKNVSVHVNLRRKEYDSLYAHAKSIIIPYHLKHMYYKLARATLFSRQIVIEDLPLYRQYEKDLMGQFVYKKFNADPDALIEILTESFIISDNHEKDKIHTYKILDINEASAIWGKII